MTVVKIQSQKELDEKFDDGYVIVDFTATWCPPCKFIAPIFENLSKIHTHVKFFKVDVDESSDIAEKYHVTSMPTFILFDKGEVVGTVLGASEAKIKDLLEKAPKTS
nr:14764_t:CDS:2 [Entrophospora candida]CAG8625157.1 5843_t:CDS:2 [Entrophospora candida]